MRAVKPLKSEVAEFKRLRIREEACHLIYQLGYEGATLDAVAERLKITKPAIYSHYRSKDEILFDICQVGISLSRNALAEALASGGTALERLRMVIERVARIVLDNQECIVVYQREEMNLDPLSARQIRDQRHMFDKDLASLLAEGVANGEFEVDDPAMAANTIGGMISWVSLWYSPGGKRSAIQIIAHIMYAAEKIVTPIGPKSRANRIGQTPTAKYPVDRSR